MKKIIIASLGILGFGYAGSTYVVPAEYDNLRESVKSTGYFVVTNTSGHYSSRTFKIGGKNLRYRCMSVPKITCRARTPQIYATISEVSGKAGGNKSVPIYSYDYRIIDRGTNWDVCTAAYGGVLWDESKINSTSSGGKTTITHTYVPNKFGDFFWFLTNDASHGDNASYISIKHKQVCR